MRPLEAGSVLWELLLTLCRKPWELSLRPIPVFQDSQLVAGVAFKKTFSYAGFEMQPKKYQSPKIALLNVELELKAEKDNAEVRVNTVEVRAALACSCS